MKWPISRSSLLPGSAQKPQPPPTERDGNGVSCSVSVLTVAEKPRIRQRAGPHSAARCVSRVLSTDTVGYPTSESYDIAL